MVTMKLQQHKAGYISVVTLAVVVFLGTLLLNFLPAVTTGKLPIIG